MVEPIDRMSPLSLFPMIQPKEIVGIGAGSFDCSVCSPLTSVPLLNFSSRRGVFTTEGSRTCHLSRTSFSRSVRASFLYPAASQRCAGPVAPVWAMLAQVSVMVALVSVTAALVSVMPALAVACSGLRHEELDVAPLALEVSLLGVEGGGAE